MILVKELMSEKERWQNTEENLVKQYDCLHGDSTIATAFLVYAGPLFVKYRHIIINSWTEILEQQGLKFTENFKLWKFLNDENDFQLWQKCGLPQDEYSLENASIILNSSPKHPYIVDPQLEATNWIIELENSRKILQKTISVEFDTFYKHSRKEIPILFANIDKTNFRNIEKYLNSNKIPASHKRPIFYFITKNHAGLPSKIKGKVTLVNFVLKEEGLETKMLGIIIKKENPSIEEANEMLSEQITDGKNRLIQLEETLLKILNESELPILEDENLFYTLLSSKQATEEIGATLAMTEKNKLDIEKTRDLYRECATRASLLFFILSDLKLINELYKFSLEKYLGLFIQSIDKSARSQIIDLRRKNIINYHTYSVYK